MEKRFYAWFGVAGPLLVFLSIGISLALSPWFSWETNALSDLGHSSSEVASIFNAGMLLAGFFLVIYALTVFKKHAKYSSYCLLASAFFVQLLATFNEAYGSLHYAVALSHFLMLSATSIVYSYEKRSAFALTTFLVVMFSWLVYSLHIFNFGISVPETVSKLVLLWIMSSGLKIYLDKETNTL